MTAPRRVTRPTADIVADLHAVIAEIPTMARLSDTAPRWLPILAKAADRLAELDALRPDCPTCGGTKWIGGPIPDDYAACPRLSRRQSQRLRAAAALAVIDEYDDLPTNRQGGIRQRHHDAAIDRLAEAMHSIYGALPAVRIRGWDEDGEESE